MNFQSKTKKSIDNLIKNFNINFIESNSDEIVTVNDHNEIKSVSFSNDLDYSSSDNSINQNSFVFVTSEQFPAISQNLDIKKPEKVIVELIFIFNYRISLRKPACNKGRRQLSPTGVKYIPSM